MVLRWIATRTRASLVAELEARLAQLQAEVRPFPPVSASEIEAQAVLDKEVKDCRHYIAEVQGLPEDGIRVLVQLSLDHMHISYERLTPEQRAILS